MDNEAIVLESREETTCMPGMLIRGGAGYEDAIKVDENTLETMEDSMRHSLKGLVSIPETEGRVYKFKHTKGSSNSGLANILGGNRNFMVASNESIFEEMDMPPERN